MSTNYNPKIITDGLVLYLDAANSKSYPRSGNTWIDLSGYNNHGTLINGVGYTANNKGSLVFDGSDDTGTIISNESLNIISTISIQSWVKFRSAPSTSGNPNIVDKWNWPDNKRSWFLGTEAGKLATRISVDGTYANSIGIIHVSPTLNAWMQLTTSFTGNDLYFYVNGNIAAAAHTDITPYFINTTTNILLGRAVGSEGSIRYLNADISNIQIYNRALSSQEVKQNFNALRSRYNI